MMVGGGKPNAFKRAHRSRFFLLTEATWLSYFDPSCHQQMASTQRTFVGVSSSSTEQGSAVESRNFSIVGRDQALIDHCNSLCSRRGGINNEDVVAARNGRTLTVGDLREMLGSSTFPSAGVDFYFDMLQHRAIMKRNKFLYMPVHFFVLLLGAYSEQQDIHFDYDAVRTYLGRINVLDVERVFIPVNVRNWHYVLIVISHVHDNTKPLNLMVKIEYYDTLQGGVAYTTNEAESFVQQMMLFIQLWHTQEAAKWGVQLDDSNYEKMSAVVTRFQKGNSCGPLILMYADCLSDNLDPNEINPKQHMDIRRRLLLMMLQQSVRY